MWAAAKFCQVSVRPIIKTAVPVLKTSLAVNSIDFINGSTTARQQIYRKLTNARSDRISHALRRTRSSDPEAAFTIGRGIVTGAGAAGLGALCYYGLGLSKEVGILENSRFWPEYVRNRVQATYMYLAGSVVISAAAATAVLRSPAMMNIFASGAILPNILLCGALIASGLIVHSIPYSPGFGAKQVSWVAFSTLVGGMLAPLSFYGGPILVRAAWYTAGIVGGLSVVAVCAPSDKFLKMGGALAIGSGLLLASGLGAMFLPPTTVVGAGLHSFFMYGGLVFFSGSLLYNTQRVAKTAEILPPDSYSQQKYDPIDMSISLFMDIVNIFTRIVFLLGSSNKKR